MFTFSQQTVIPRSAEDVYAWHAAGGALNKLIPPWQKVTVIMHDGINEGSLAVLRLHIGPLRIIWQALHTDVIPGRQFRDVQLCGPFKSWIHTHRMTPTGTTSCSSSTRNISTNTTCATSSRSSCFSSIRCYISSSIRNTTDNTSTTSD